MFRAIKSYHDELGHNMADGSLDQRMQSMRNSALALMIELAELVDSTPWKPWRPVKDQTFDKDNAVREAIDILFFLVSICEELHITPQELEKKFEQVMTNNFARLDSGYSKKGGGKNVQ
jgi:dimeric dUTPase (all-alpha-NTP-PPase superfamily)